MGALDSIVRSGKALYVGISSYSGARTAEAIRICERNNFIKPVIHQPNYSMLSRWIEPDLLPVTKQIGMGVIAFCPLQQGLLTNKYLNGVPDDSRVASKAGFLNRDSITPENMTKVQRLNELAQQRGQSLAQMSLSWVLRDEGVTSALIGASRPEQIVENVAAAQNTAFGEDELKKIDEIVS